jgi:hypothetical protein
MSGVHLISHAGKGGTAVDVIFVHGLGGDHRCTWQVDERATTFWPSWLDEDLAEVTVYSLDFKASPSAWLGSSMPLNDRAVNILALLEAEGLGTRPLIFVVHSLGGLVIKQMLRSADDYGEPSWKRLAEQTRGIVFLATPHAGARLATYMGALGRIFRLNVTVSELEANVGLLRDLNLWYRNNADRLKIRTRVFFETQNTHSVRIVDEASADPGIAGVVPYPVDADHFTICKPANRGSLIYKSTRKFIIDSFPTSIEAVSQLADGLSKFANNPEAVQAVYRAAEDARLAVLLQEGFLNAGHDVFIDVAMTVGTDWSAEIGRRIECCDYLVVLLSEKSVLSEMVQAEIRLAHQSRRADGRPGILPIRVAYSGPLDYELHSYIGRLQYVVWQAPGDDTRVIREILRVTTAGQKLSQGGVRSMAAWAPIQMDRGRPMPSVDRRTLKRPGGAIDAEDDFYIRRPADDTVENIAAEAGVTLVIKAPRQTGKSSLLIRYLAACESKEKRIVSIDLQSFTNAELDDLPCLLRSFAAAILQEIDLDTIAAPVFTIPLHLTHFLEKIIADNVTQPLTLALDEVDRLLGRKAQIDFFAMLRSWHNRRAKRGSPWKRIDLALVIATEPYLLIDRKDQSPFNVGELITLKSFSREEVHQINRIYGADLTEQELDSLYDLLYGHPFLTRLAFYRLAGPESMALSELLTTAADDDGPFIDHLKALLMLVERQPALANALWRLVQDDRFPSHDTVLFDRLRGAGLARRAGNRIVPANLLYARFFKRVL